MSAMRATIIAELLMQDGMRCSKQGGRGAGYMTAGACQIGRWRGLFLGAAGGVSSDYSGDDFGRCEIGAHALLALEQVAGIPDWRCCQTTCLPRSPDFQ